MRNYSRFGFASTSLLCVATMLALSTLTVKSAAQSVLSELPEKLNPNARYLIYVHGRIVEHEGPEAVSERFGPYQFAEISTGLSSRGHVVIAELRRPSGLEYVDTIVNNVRKLKTAGVPSENITVVGFSKGGYMTLRAARELKQPDVNYAILAGCVAGAISGEDLSGDGLEGRLLSMADSADNLGFPCSPLFERNSQLDSPISMVFHEGTGHGLFYAADPVWMTPLLDWIDTAHSIGIADIPRH